MSIEYHSRGYRLSEVSSRGSYRHSSANAIDLAVISRIQAVSMRTGQSNRSRLNRRGCYANRRMCACVCFKLVFTLIRTWRSREVKLRICRGGDIKGARNWRTISQAVSRVTTRHCTVATSDCRAKRERDVLATCSRNPRNQQLICIIASRERSAYEAPAHARVNENEIFHTFDVTLCNFAA
jgi:hypothetical protein